MHKSRGARGAVAGGGTNHGLLSNENLVQVSPRAVPAKSLVPVSQHDSHHYMIAGPALDITFWIKGIAAEGGTYVMLAKSSLGSDGLIMGCLGEKQEAQKGRSSGDFGKSKGGKINTGVRE